VSTIEQLGNAMIAAVSGWGIDGAPTDIRAALALLPQAKAVRFRQRFGVVLELRAKRDAVV
jgi:hypothetical protein